MPAEITTARRYGVHPLQHEPFYTSPQTTITINLPQPLWQWLKGFGGKNSFTHSVEETIVTALRCIAGKDCELGMDGSQFIMLSVIAREISPAVAMFGPMQEQAEHEVGLLLQAAEAAACGTDWIARDGLDDEPSRAAAILKAWSAVSGRDVAAQVEQDRERQAAEDAAHAKTFLDAHDPDSADFAERFPDEHAAIKAADGGSGKRRPLSGDVDDDMPF